MIFPTQEQLAIFKATEGAISVHEMVGIMNVAAMAPRGVCAEMGSHRGKSGIAAAIGLLSTTVIGRALDMVDPLYDMQNLEAWKHADQGHPDNAWQGATRSDFKDDVKKGIFHAANGGVVPILHGDYSLHAIADLHGKFGDFAYVFLDSDQHQYDLVKAECDLLRDKMVLGGIIAFHDLNSQFTGVSQVYREMVQGGQFNEIGVPWPEIKEWVSANGGEAGNRSWHHVHNPAPTFFGAIQRVR